MFHSLNVYELQWHTLLWKMAYSQLQQTNPLVATHSKAALKKSHECPHVCHAVAFAKVPINSSNCFVTNAIVLPLDTDSVMNSPKHIQYTLHRQLMGHRSSCRVLIILPIVSLRLHLSRSHQTDKRLILCSVASVIRLDRDQ